jgi:hypothetical protein
MRRHIPGVWLFLLFGSHLAQAAEQVRFKIPAQPRRISPEIYGFGTYMHEDRDKEQIWEMQPTNYRWGGNTSSRFNYKIDAWNAAQDWFFHNYAADKPKMIPRFMAENVKRKAASYITLPMLPWIAKDGTSMSFPRSLFPNQERFDGDAGNGIGPDGKPLKADPKLTSIPNSPEFVAGWVKELKTQFGPYPHYYIMDNEPMLWNSTHRDVVHEPLRYDTYLARYISFAQAVRKADPAAVIVGPAAWGWMEMQYSAWDIEGPHSNGKKQTDRKAHGDQPFLEWFLDQLKKKEKELKISLLDQLDVHYYPEMDRWPSGDDKNPARRKALLNSTRSLWDPQYKDESWINEKIQFIPRLQALAKRLRPDVKVSIGEYNFRSEYDVAGAVAQAEILGIFARTGLHAAQYWDFPRRDGTHRYAFLLFRNYDGKGASFGDEWIDNTVNSQEHVSVFAARHSKSRRVTIVLLNKHVDQKQTLKLDLKPWASPKGLRLFSYFSPSNDGKIKGENRKLKPEPEVSISMQPLSMHLLELAY